MKDDKRTPDLEAEIQDLRARLDEAEEALRAIREHEVDALLLEGPEGPQIYTLQGAEQPYRFFVECMNEGAVTMTPDGTILHCNTRFAEMLERPINNVIGVSFYDFLAPEKRDPFRNMARGCDPQGRKGEFLLGTSSKKKVPAHLSVKPLSGEQDILCVVVTDLTELKQAEDALLRSNEELELQIIQREKAEDQILQTQKMEAMGTLSGGIAHDFNNILAGIIGFTEIALDTIPPDNPAHHPLKLVLKSGFRGRDLVKQILSFSRKADHKREPVALSPLVSETMKLLRASLPTTIRITINMDARSDVVFANPSELQQIIMNLSTNAAHAMMDKGGELNITLAEAEITPGSVPGSELIPGHYVELTVKDTGTGIDADIVNRIFEPFFTTKGPGQGTGMGLAVVYGAVKSLNGDVAVESTPGVGSTFRVLFPSIAKKASHEAVQKVPRGRERVLFVDDEELLAKLGKDTLEKLGYKVTAMTNSAEALDLFSRNPSGFDLVFTDQTMPEITGLNLAREFLRIRADLPIILATGHSDSVSKEKAMAAGIRGFLMKPLSRYEMAVAVRRVLDEKP